MAPKFKMDAKKFLSLKIFKFEFYVNYFLHYLNLANFSFSLKNFFLKYSTWPKNSIWQIFCTKIYDFLAVEPLNERFKFSNIIYFLCYSIVKNLLPIVKIQNCTQFKMEAKTFLAFKTCKFQDCLNLANCSSFPKKIFFLKYSKWPKINIVDFKNKTFHSAVPLPKNHKLWCKTICHIEFSAILNFKEKKILIKMKS
jgi:hypothetical protein